MFTRVCQQTRLISSPLARQTRKTRTQAGASGLSILLLATLLAGCGSAEKSGLYLQDAYIKSVIPGRSMTAAYATLTNHLPETLCLASFEADFAASVELHITERVGGPNSEQVRMRHINELCLSPGESVDLAPGGRHLMLMGLSQLPPRDAHIRLATTEGRLFDATFKVHPFNQPYPQ